MGGGLRPRRASGGSSPTTPTPMWSRSPASPRDGERVLVFVANLSPVPREGYRLGLPRSCRWRRRSTPIRRFTAAATWATSAGWSRADPLARPAGLGRGDAAPAGRGLVGPGLLVALPESPWERPLGARPVDDELVEFRVWAPRPRLGGALARWRPELPMEDDRVWGSMRWSPRLAPGTTTCLCSMAQRLPDPCSRWQPEGLRGPSRVVGAEPRHAAGTRCRAGGACGLRAPCRDVQPRRGRLKEPSRICTDWPSWA